MLTFASYAVAEKLSRHVVGQRAAVEDVVSAICENMEAFFLEKPMKVNNILLYGPTGSGKTELARSITKVLDIPFLKETMNDFTLTGYKGRDPQEIVTRDFKKLITSEEVKAISEKREKFLVRKEALEVLKESDLSSIEFLIALEFASSTVFMTEEEALSILRGKYRGRESLVDSVASMVNIVLWDFEGNINIGHAIDEAEFRSKPFGVVFIDEIDKILINERDGYSESFYRPLQEFILTMVEGSVVTHEDWGSIDTSHITFILAGAFINHSIDEIIPELKGRLNVRVKVRELGYEDYLEIARLQKLEIPEILSGKVVEIRDGVFEEVARICEELNAEEYLGARRIKEVISKVNRAIKKELTFFSGEEPLVIDKSFVRWAVSFDSSRSTDCQGVSVFSDFSRDSGLGKSKLNKTKMKEIKKRLRDKIFRDLVEKYRRKIEEFSGKLTVAFPFSVNVKELKFKNSEGKTVIEYLVEKGILKEMTEGNFRFLKKKLSKRIVDNISRHLVVRKFPDDIDF